LVIFLNRRSHNLVSFIRKSKQIGTTCGLGLIPPSFPENISQFGGSVRLDKKKPSWHYFHNATVAYRNYL